MFSCIILTSFETFPTVMRSPLMFPRVRAMVRRREAAELYVQLLCVGLIHFLLSFSTVAFLKNFKVQNSSSKILFFIQNPVNNSIKTQIC